jgi:Uma2 family endonuclease
MFETPEKELSLDEFFAFIEQQPDDGTKYELHQGVLVQVPLSKATQTVIAGRLIRYVGQFVDDNTLGVVASSDGGFKIPPIDFYAPDMSYYSRERVPQIPENEYFTVAPDLAAEVVSKSDENSAHLKVLRYLELGTRMAWVVYPKAYSVHVYRPYNRGFQLVVLTIDDTLSGEDVLPEFTLPVKKVFGV